MPTLSLTVYYQGRSEEMDLVIEKLVGRESVASGTFLPTGQRDLEFYVETSELPRIARKLKKAGFLFTTYQEPPMSEPAAEQDPDSTPKEFPRFKTIINRPDAGVVLVHDYKRFQYFLKFASKPDEALLAHVKPDIKEAGMHWDPDNQGWAKRIPRDEAWKVKADLERAADAIADKIVAFRQDHGQSVEGGRSL